MRNLRLNINIPTECKIFAQRFLHFVVNPISIVSGNVLFSIFAIVLIIQSKLRKIRKPNPQNPAKNISVGLPGSPIKCWGKSVHEFMSYDLTNKQTENTTLLLPPCTRTWTIIIGNWIFAIKVDPLNLESQTFL